MSRAFGQPAGPPRAEPGHASSSTPGKINMRANTSRAKFRAFTPSGGFNLEDRVVLSDSGLTGPAIVQTAAQTSGDDLDFRIPTDPLDRSPLVDQVQGQINQAFVDFAGEYRDLRLAYLTSVLGEQPDAGILPDARDAFSQYQEATREQVQQLRSGILDVLDNVEGGAAVLDTYAAVRAGQLGDELTSIPGVGEGPFNPVEFASLSEQAMADALFSINQFVELYDTALFQTASGIFSGNLRFFRGGDPSPEEVPLLSPIVGEVQGEFNSAFAALANDFRQLRTDSFNELGDGEADPNAFRQQMANRIEALRVQLIDAIDSPTGGPGVLAVFLNTQINQFQQTFARLPVAGESGLTPDGYSALAEGIIARSLNDANAMVQLYDVSLATTAMNFFNANQDFRDLANRLNAPFPGGGRPFSGGVGVASQTAGESVGTARQFGGGLGGGFGGIGGGLGGFDSVGGFGGGVTGGFGGLGGIPTGLAGSYTDRLTPDSFFNTTPTGFDRGLGFGGLGGFGGLSSFGGLGGLGTGFDLGPVTSVGGSAFGNGFGFGGTTFPGFGNAGLAFGNTVGFGTPGVGYGLGNGFGVVGGPGYGTGVGFGGFFF
jgi:hypothetical protein